MFGVERYKKIKLNVRNRVAPALQCGTRRAVALGENDLTAWLFALGQLNCDLAPDKCSAELSGTVVGMGPVGSECEDDCRQC